MEPLEARWLLSIGGLGAVGDSLTDDYVDQGIPGAFSWVETQGASGVNVGGYRVDPATWGDVREQGWEYNWAQAGATAASLLADGQHTGLAQQVIDGDVTHAVMAIGQNDYWPLGAAYLGIYSGTWDPGDIYTHNQGILANMETALATLTATDVALVIANVIDYGVAPSVWGNPALSSVAGRQAVADAISQLNEGVAALAAGFGIPLIDMYGLTKDYLGEHGSEVASLTVGGEVITNTAGVDGHNAFTPDGIHPHTVLQAISANCYIEGLNLGYGAGLDQLSEVEMLLLAGIFGAGETLLVDYPSYVHLPRDFGDAPDGAAGTGTGDYNTRDADGGPSHVIVAGLLMGANLDGELDAAQSPAANGDDTDRAPDDEDGLVDPAVDLALVEGAAPAVEVTVTNSTGTAATLYGWIDYNADGVFDNATERASVAVPDGTNGVVTLNFPAAPQGSAGDTFARFRLSTDAAAANATGDADDGEVEDYAVSIDVLADFGDAPDEAQGTGAGDYNTLAADNGPSHVIVEGLLMGANLDGETDAFPSAGADGDDTDGTPDDEDGLVDPAGDLSLLVGVAPAVEVTVTNTTGGAATLYGWIDYNGDGVFDNATERASVAVPDGTNGVVTLNFPAVPQGSAGDTFARFRLSTDAAAADATGSADDGEVEDYTVSIDALDFGDAPDEGQGTGEGDYNTRAADDGPSHLIVPGLKIGANIDGEPDGFDSPGNGDDNDGTPDDEDGLSLSYLPVPQGSAPEVPVTVTNTTGGAATLYGWIDYNDDGVFDNATERASAPVPDGTNGGVVTLNFPAAPVTPTGTWITTFARFRLSTDAAAADPTGEAGDGEVEDHYVQIVPADFGDAPDPYDAVLGEYPTLLPGGAWSYVDLSHCLGELIDAEADGQPTPLADGDDTNGLDDDDGVLLQSAIVPGEQLNLNVYLTDVHGVGGTLSAWIDLDQNGDWLGAGERFLLNEALVAGDNQIQVSVPASASVGPTYVRFRLGGVQPGGYSGGYGEVEDYRAIVVSEDLGQIGFAERTELDLSGGDLWYQIETTRAGYLTFQATCAAGAGTAELTVYDADGAEVDSSATGTGTERVEFDAVAAGEVYYVKLAGTNTDVELKALNMLSLVGTAAYVMGTDGDDSCTYDTDASRLITVNGVEYHFTDPEVDCLLFMGAGGNDSAVFNGSAADEWVRMFPRSRTMALAPWRYTFATTRVETVTAHGGGGDDTVQMYDSPQDDVFSAGPDWAEMSGPGFTLSAYDFRWMHSYSEQGGDDKAELSDVNADPGTDEPVRLYGIPGDSRFCSWGYGFCVRMRNFGQVSAQGTGDDDVAILMDSAGADSFEGYADWGRMTYEDGTYVEASDYRYLHGFSRQGSNDKARVYDETVAGAGYATTFIGYPGSPTLYLGQNERLVRTWEFEELRVSTDGVGDVAKLYDSPAHSDWLVVPYAGSTSYDPAEAVFQNAYGLIFLDAFEWLKAVTSEDTDTAQIDPAYADKVILEGNWIVL